MGLLAYVRAVILQVRYYDNGDITREELTEQLTELAIKFVDHRRNSD